MQFCTAPLHEYQQVPSSWMLDHPDQKGLLVVLGTGYGKTRAASDAIIGLLRSGMCDNCFVITPAKLQANFKQGLEECGARNLDIRILSMDALIKHLDTLPINSRSLILVDESHNFRNTQTSRYRAMKAACSRAGKVLLFTATPMKTNPDDVIPQLGLFLNLQRLKDDQDLFHRIRNHVAYFSLDGTKYDTKPRVKYFSVLVPMTKVQEDHIVEIMEENKITTLGQLDAVMNKAEDEDDASSSEGTHTQKALNSFFNKVRRFANSEAAKVCSPKMLELAKLLKHANGQAMVFSFWIAMGVELAAQCIHNAMPNHKLGLLTGSVSQKHLTKTLQDYNDKKLQTLIFSSSASEGVSTKGTEIMVMLEPQWQYVAEQQAIARAVRINSHPPNSEVHVYYLLSHSDKFAIANIDELMFQKNREKYNFILQRMELLRQASIPVSDDAVIFHNFTPEPVEHQEHFTRLLRGVKGLPGKDSIKKPAKVVAKAKKIKIPKVSKSKKPKIKISKKPKIPKVSKTKKPKIKIPKKPKITKTKKLKTKKTTRPKAIAKPKKEISTLKKKLKMLMAKLRKTRK